MATPTYSQDADSADNVSAREFEIVCRKADAPRLSNVQLTEALRLALVCTSILEQGIVGYHAWHKLTLEETAERLGQPVAHVKDLFNSLVHRVALADSRQQKQSNIVRVYSRSRRARQKRAAKRG